MRGRTAAWLILVNVGLALLLQYAAPTTPRNTDRREYEYVGEHGLQPNCPWSIYCYRVLVPVALAHIPADSERRWRWYQATATAAAGTITSLMTAQIARSSGAGALAALLAQTSYGFAFTAYDPYTADPLVFVFAAAIAWWWLEDRWRPALAAGLVGIFAKETVALVVGACAAAAVLDRGRATSRAWIAGAIAVTTTLLAFHWVMDTWFGWGIGSSPAAQLGAGSWLARWWENNPFLTRKLLLLFAPFGFAWLFAVLGYFTADPRLRLLGLGAVIPFTALCYLQTPERALSNMFFVVVPLASLYLARAPFVLALLASAANGALTLKIGTSSGWMPSSQLLLAAAAALAAAVIWVTRRRT